MCRTVYLFVFCVIACHAIADLSDVQFKDRLVVNVLDQYKTQGYAFVYSSSLLRPHLKFESNVPANNQPIERLREALEALQLTLRQAITGPQWFIVKAPPKPPTIRGRVTDSETGTPLAGVRVKIGARAVFTNNEGVFILHLQDTPHPVSFNHPGYETKEIVSTRVNDVLDLLLTPSNRIEEVTVVSSRYKMVKADEISRHQFASEELTSAPSLGEDSLRAVTRLPGSASVGVSARPHIRGGLQDETLVLFNNIELSEPFHLKDFQSVFSSLNPNLIKAMDVYTGGFPARYGDRMSAVIDITPTDDIAALGGDLSLSLLTSSLTGFGQFAGNDGRWQFSARRGNLDLLTQEINPNLGRPSYVDAFGQVAWSANEELELETGFLIYNDNIKLEDIEADGKEGTRAISKYRNTYGWLQAHRQLSTNTKTTTLVSYGTTHTSRDGSINEEDADGGFGDLSDRRTFKLWSLAHNWLQHADNDSKSEWGLRLNYQRGSYHYQRNLERGFLSRIIAADPVQNLNVSAKPEGLSGNGFISLRRKPFPGKLFSRLTVEAGLRWDFQDFSERGFDQQISPRLSLKYDFTPNTIIRTSAGRFHQADGIHELQVSDGHNRYQGVQHSDHFIVGVEHFFNNPDWHLRIEGFYKRIQNPKRRYENLFNPLVFLPETAPDRIQVAPSRALAKGVEVSVLYNPSSNLSTTFTYSRASVRDLLNGDWQSRTWDQKHSATASLNWIQLPWSVSLFTSWHSGWLITETPPSVSDLTVINFQRNDTHLPHFLSVDAKIMYTWKWPRQSFSVFTELTNLTDRDNVGGHEVDLEEDEATGGYTVISQDRTLLPLVPSIGFRWQF